MLVLTVPHINLNLNPSPCYYINPHSHPPLSHCISQFLLRSQDYFKFPMDSPSTTITSVHPDIIQTHILTRLDGPTLAAAGAASSQLHALATVDKLWRDICTSTWPSLNDPTLQALVSAFPGGHRSFFSDSYPLLAHPLDQYHGQSRKIPPTTSSPTLELISAVDIHYKNSLIFSKVEATETITGWFQCSPFRVDLLDPKDTVPTPVQYSVDRDYKWLSHLEDTLTLSWILIDPTRKRAANLSSLRPVSVKRHWLTGEVQIRYATVVGGDRTVGSEVVQCGIVVTCAGKEGGEMQVREVNLQVEDMEGRHLNGKESLVILQEALENGRRKKAKGEEGKARYERYLEMMGERRERRLRREKTLDMVCIALGVTIFLSFWSYFLFT